MTRSTRSGPDNQLTSRSSTSEADPSMSRQLVEHAQLSPITTGQSNFGPPNSRQVTIVGQRIQDSGSQLSSSPERHLSQEELEKKRDKYNTLLGEYKSNKANRAKGQQEAHNATIKTHQKKIICYHQKILEEMLLIVEQFNAKGFLYGMVTETSKLMTRAFDSLRAWWKRQVIFDKTGPAQIDQYYKLNDLYSNVADIDNKSTTELLKELSHPTLGSILSLLMQHCDPPQWKFPFANGLRPPWWPTGQESWWNQTGIPTNEGPPPFTKPHDLKKKWKIALIIAIIKLTSPNFSKPHYHVDQSHQLGNRMNARERKFWTLALVAEAKQYCQNHPNMPTDEAIAFLAAYGDIR